MPKTLIVNISPGILNVLTKAGFKLCYSFAIGNEFNVVAKTSVLTSKNNITWNEQYSIYGTNQKLKPGDMIKNDGESETHSIVFGQTCKLRAWDWSSVVADVTLSPKTFGFASDLAATPVICLNISDLEDRPVHVPIFVGNHLAAGGSAAFRPKSHIAVWFQRGLETATMIGFSRINVHIMDMTQVETFEATYDDEGLWNDKDSLEYKSVNYFSTTPPASIEPKAEDHTMSSKELVVNVPPSICRTLNDAGFKLCFAISVDGTFNVVAKASVIANKNTITWAEHYSVFSTVQTFSPGDIIIRGKSETCDIQFGHTYMLKDWNSISVFADKTLPSGTFGFSNGVHAAPVICMKIDGLERPAPIFIGNKLLSGGSRTFLQPKQQVAVWFQRGLETSTMIVFSTIHAFVIDMADVKHLETTYNDQGQWKFE